MSEFNKLKKELLQMLLFFLKLRAFSINPDSQDFDNHTFLVPSFPKRLTDPVE
jgi:hypothetical protein